jgi:DNA-binding PadR family transcriptional regulator
MYRIDTSSGRIDVGGGEIVLELAVLGLLHESPMHGYELRKRLNTLLGPWRAFSFGSLYPCLSRLEQNGFVTKDGASTPGRRAKVVYKLTAEGKEHFQTLLHETGPSQWDDELFGVHFAFFAHTDAEARLRLLEGRRHRLEERKEGFRATLGRAREKLDHYTLELQRHGLESVEREVRWLTELIEDERSGRRTTRPTSDPAPQS